MTEKKEEDSFEKAAIAFIEKIANWDDRCVLTVDTARLRQKAQDIMQRRSNPGVPKTPERP